MDGDRYNSNGTFITELTITSFIVAILIYLGFTLGRLISFKFDGKSNGLIVKGIMFELVFGLVNIVCLVNYGL